MNKIEYIAVFQDKVVGVFDAYSKAYEALPTIQINECFGPNEIKLGIIYQREIQVNLNQKILNEGEMELWNRKQC